MPAAPVQFEPKVGALVNVASRTWPGINQPGGIGKISGITIEDGAIFVDVEYVLGGKEKAVEIEFVQEHKFDEENHGRPARSRRTRVTEESTIPGKKKVDIKKQKKSPVQKSALQDVSSSTNRTEPKEKGKKHKLSGTSKPLQSKKSRSSVARSGDKDDSDATCMKTKDIPRVDKSESMDCLVRNVKTQQNNIAEKSSPVSFVKSSSSSHSEVTPSRFSGFLKNVYSDMSKKAANFVETVIGKNASRPSSPESTVSDLEVQIDAERESQFNSIFFNVVREKMIDSIDINELMSEVNAANKNKIFTELELRSHLQRLDKESKIMVTWDTGTIYML